MMKPYRFTFRFLEHPRPRRAPGLGIKTGSLFRSLVIYYVDSQFERCKR